MACLKTLFGNSFCLTANWWYLWGLELKLVLFGLGEKPYACAVCDMRFIQRYHLERHSLIHTGMRLLTVPILHKLDYLCSLSLVSMDRCSGLILSLDSHFQQSHPSKSVQPQNTLFVWIFVPQHLGKFKEGNSPQCGPMVLSPLLNTLKIMFILNIYVFSFLGVHYLV